MCKRLPAEWEKQRALALVFPTNQKDWQHSIDEIQKSYVNFIETVRVYQLCIILCHNTALVESFFTDMNNLSIYEIQTDDTWIRDFGAIECFEENNLFAYNFTFNAWGNKFSSNLDNGVNEILNQKGFFHNFKNIPFILEGGSIDSNGKGTLLSTAKCLFNKNRNAHLKKEKIIQKLKSLFGLKNIIILNHGHLLGDDTDAHIDTLARFIDEQTIAYIQCENRDDIHYKELKLMEEELEKTGFELLALPMPKAHFYQNHRLPATYINFVFINGALIVPTYNDPNDEVILTKLAKRLPHLEIKGVDSSIFIREHGSLHCSCMNYFAAKCYKYK